MLPYRTERFQQFPESKLPQGFVSKYVTFINFCLNTVYLPGRNSMKFCTFSVCLLVSLVSVFANSTFAQDAEYELMFEGRWVAPAPVPGSAHFTQIIGATHNANGSIYSVGQLASQGVENVAELGSVGALTSEINASIAAGNAETLLLGGDTFITPEEVDTFTFGVNASHSRISLLTMLAPSPDWFVGVNDLDLLDGNGNWQNQIVLDLVTGHRRTDWRSARLWFAGSPDVDSDQRCA